MLPGSHKSKGKQSTDPLNLITANVFLRGDSKKCLNAMVCPKVLEHDLSSVNRYDYYKIRARGSNRCLA